MTAIKTDQYAGGRNLTRGQGAPGQDLASTERDMADDFATLQIPTVTSADATDLATAITLVNEIKAKLNVIAAATIKTTKT